MQNKVVIITGASSGIGKALVYEFAKRGAKIAMGARNLDELQKIETDLKSRVLMRFPFKRMLLGSWIVKIWLRKQLNDLVKLMFL